jgi:hypothetical protein
MRELTDHIVDGKCANLTVEVLDEPGQGGACHHYAISGFHTKTNPSADTGRDDDTICHILFQNGPINEDGNGPNGIQNEDLLAILIDRMRGFQSGPYACEFNEEALGLLERALQVMQERTRDRLARNVEGTHKV